MDEYISREDILDIASQYCTDDDGSCSKADVDLREMLDEIEALPAADVQPVKHGKWIDAYTWTMFHEFKSSGRGEHFWCSECKQGQKQKSNYCPNCGARMDGGVNDDRI